MANTTAKGALHIRGTNPQHLVEKVIRSRIYDSAYWKEHCFALTAASLVPTAAGLGYVGGTYGGAMRVSPFVCLVLKLLQLQPEKEVVLEYLTAVEFKYLRAVAAMYVRLTFPSIEVYEVLEPMLNDYRKLRWRDSNGSYRLTHMDAFIDDLLTQERVADLILPRLTRRDVLEEKEGLAPRTSRLEEAIVGGAASDDEGAQSDDSLREMREERKRRVERARAVREKLGGAGAGVTAMEVDQRSDEEEAYQSQEESEGERFVSRSPSRPSRSRSASEAGGYVSRSPSRSPDRGGYVSRSPSRSPDRA